MILRTAVIGVGHLGRQHARIHRALAAEGYTEFSFGGNRARGRFVAVCDEREFRTSFSSERAMNARVLASEISPGEEAFGK